MKFKVNISFYGEKAILIDWPREINEEISAELLKVQDYLKEEYWDQLLDIANGYQSLLLYYKSTVTLNLLQDVKSKLSKIDFNNYKKTPTLWKIPVCYDLDFGIDSTNFLELKGLSLTDLINMHTAAVYHIYGKGFLPGFLYLGGLDEKLFLERKSIPNLKIPKNSVAIGGQQTGIYPSQSPGGWHVIGSTPLSFFNIKNSPPSQIEVGDKVKFHSISKQEYFNIKNKKLVIDS